MTSIESVQYYRQRRTISEQIEIEGIGIHTGRETSIRLEPSKATEEIQFIRTDDDSEVCFRPSVDRVENDDHATVLQNQGENLYTVEHLLAALFGLGVTDVTVYIDGPEIPAMDGSADGFVKAIHEAGLERLNEDRPVYRVQEPIFTQDDDRSIAIFPSDELKISCSISYENDYIGDQFFSLCLTPERFSEDIAPARTFGFKEDVEDLLEKDLARGGSLDNALVLDKDGNLVGDEPQFPDEFVRHKILDLLGDLSLAGSYFTGHVVAVKNGHSLNLSLAEKLAHKVDHDPSIAEQRASRVDQEGMSIEKIKTVLPHRYPMLLIDRILMIDLEEQRAQGLKNVTMNEQFFQGHFPDDPVMPGVLIIEALAQLGGAVILNMPHNEGKNSYFMGVNNVKWRRPVRPGDQLFLEVEGTRLRAGARAGEMKAQAFVDGDVAAEGELKFYLVDE